MKTAEQILKEKTGHAHGLMDSMVIEAMKEYALEVARQTLVNASENAMMIYTHFMDDSPTVCHEYTIREHMHGGDSSYNIKVYKYSIRDESNIPEL